jgi:hypothetical protein
VFEVVGYDDSNVVEYVIGERLIRINELILGSGKEEGQQSGGAAKGDEFHGASDKFKEIY